MKFKTKYHLASFRRSISIFFPFYGDNTLELKNINQLLDNGIVYEGMNSPIQYAHHQEVQLLLVCTQIQLELKSKSLQLLQS